MSDDRKCECGGEAQVEYFDPIRRPIEWFVRCRVCGKILTKSASSSVGALKLWAKKEAA